MIVKFLDKFGKLVKSITSIGYLPVDVEPVKDSKHLSSSGAIANIGFSIAPEYTKKTYEANSYVMYGGVLYTNENAIGTAEDWNPAHWTQTTVAEMMAGAGNSGYKQVNLTFDSASTKTIPVGQKEEVHATCTIKSSDYVIIQLAEDCTDAVVLFERVNSTAPMGLKVMRGDTQIKCYGSGLVTHVSGTSYQNSDRVLLTTYIEEEHGSEIPMTPPTINEITLAEYGDILASVNELKVGQQMSMSGNGAWLLVVKGSYVMCLPE